jgi:Zn-dependent peptidase ImmA (M78 family)/predicted secreted protein
MASAIATAIRTGTMAAGRLHRHLGSQEASAERGGNIDVFEAFLTVDLPHLLRPLNGLLGVYLKDPTPGVLITTQRPLSVQRFTAAHELGHFFLGHEPSLDDEGILRRSPFSAASAPQLREAEANAFAAAFLMPRWLIEWHCRRQNWTTAAFSNHTNLYQLSLRLGVSYEATCWTLQQYRLLTTAESNAARAHEPREFKTGLLADYHPNDYRGDVWLLTERDAGTRIDGSRNDLFVLRLAENSGAGYLWDFDQLQASGFAILRDAVESTDGDGIGGPVVRQVTASAENAGRGRVTLDERQPWDSTESLHTLTLLYDLTGPEPEGLSRAERRHILAAA